MLLPLAWPATRLAEVSSNDEACRVYQGGDSPGCPPDRPVCASGPEASGYHPIEKAQVHREVLSVSSLTYRGPPAR